MKLHILYEDDDLIALNKPHNTLSVPGRLHRIDENTPSRSSQWALVVQTLTKKLEATEPSSPLLIYTKKLELLGTTVPRNELKLIGFLKRTVRLYDTNLQNLLWKELCEVDRELHTFDLSKLPNELISIADLVEEHCQQKIQHIHRLDQETSGVLVFAKNAKSAASLASQFRHRTVSKTYLARVHGCLTNLEGMIDVPIGPDEIVGSIKQRVDLEKGKASQTHYVHILVPPASSTTSPSDSVTISSDHARIYEAGLKIFPLLSHYPADHSLVQLNPLTGRTHQLRVHLLSIHHPILGDSLYCPEQCHINDRLCLHAWKLKFVHPTTNEEMIIVAE